MLDHGPYILLVPWGLASNPFQERGRPRPRVHVQSLSEPPTCATAVCELTGCARLRYSAVASKRKFGADSVHESQESLDAAGLGPVRGAFRAKGFQVAIDWGSDKPLEE